MMPKANTKSNTTIFVIFFYTAVACSRRNKFIKKMFKQDEEKMECAVGNREMGFWQYKKAEIVLISFLTS